MRYFSAEMMIALAAAAAVTAAAAAALWPDDRRPYLAGLAFALTVVFTGAIVANRYDAVVALDIALCLLCLARRWYSAAAVVIGLGFALKLTPAIILPLVFFLDPRLRQIALRSVYFALAAFLPFVPYLAHGTKGLEYIFTYHLDRPLQIESVLTTPFWIGHLAHSLWLQIGTDYGSQYLIVTNADESIWTLHGLLDPAGMARVSGFLTLVAMAVVYALVWRRRQTLQESPQLVPIVVLALIMAFMSFGKVLSPQFVIWMLPAVALVVIERKVVGIGAFLILGLTHAMFPAQYWALVGLERTAVEWQLVARNLLVVIVFCLSLWQLWRLPAADATGGARAGRPEAGHDGRRRSSGDEPSARPSSSGRKRR
jgi:uncharacterized membrane protein